MPTILLKKSDTASAVPTTANLTNLAGGVEVAVNTADRRMFTMNSSSAVVELGTNPSSLTLTGGTANGVLYLNGSKAVTSGSALVFDGTNLGIGTTSPANALEISRGAGVAGGASLRGNGNSAAAEFFVGQGGGSDAFLYNRANATMIFGTNNTTRMTLDSSGNVGIGTASPGVRADISGVMRSATWSLSGTGVAGGTTAFSAGTVSTDSNWGMYFRAGTGSSAIAEYSFRNAADTERMRIAPTGNLLVGTTTDVSGLSGVISDVAGNVRAIPRAGAAKTSTYTLAITDIGDYVELGTGGGIDVPNGVFSTGDVVSVFNNTTGNRTISLTITTAYIAGTDADKASVTLATRGVATVLFISNSVCVVSGNVT